MKIITTVEFNLPEIGVIDDANTALIDAFGPTLDSLDPWPILTREVSPDLLVAADGTLVATIALIADTYGPGTDDWPAPVRDRVKAIRAGRDIIREALTLAGGF